MLVLFLSLNIANNKNMIQKGFVWKKFFKKLLLLFEMMPMGQYAKCICTKSPFSVAFFRTFMAYSCPLSTPLIFLTRNTCNDNYHKHHILCNCSFVVTFLKQKKKKKTCHLYFTTFKNAIFTLCRLPSRSKLPSRYIKEPHQCGFGATETTATI